MDIDAIYEARTDAMIDELYNPGKGECAWCDEWFKLERNVESKRFPKLDFCCEDCLAEYEEANPEEE